MNCRTCKAETEVDPCPTCAAVLAEFPMPPVFPCMTCKTGEVLFRENGQCTACADSAAREQTRRERLAKTVDTIPETLRWATFDSPALATRVKDPRALRIARVLPSFTMLVLRGPAGVGKTSLACALLRREAERLGRFGTFVDTDKLACARADSKLGQTPVLEAEAESAGILLLDELGDERDIASSPVRAILRRRHAIGRPTVITTWRSYEELTARYGDGIGRRLNEHRRALVLELALPETVAAAS